jgi:hypothetical protein
MADGSTEESGITVSQSGITVPKRENCTLRLKPLSQEHFSDTCFP